METEEFYKCQLTKRHWEIERGEGQSVQVIEGEGVVGYYPTIEKGMNQPFIYESCSPTQHLGSKMSGWFEFRYLEGPKKNQRFKAMIKPFTLGLQCEGPHARLLDDPTFDQWM
ncbi:hypothetical protein FGO68_gene1988 [Halteria grandinella]|uniref:ApaG domain-containing protein n=1 Tax=Halteria grandinella TaxID=5974 RepID=A0A8J8NRX0_HALGN|nr:hypothetical protein FGO68_gene1988 [Halteria grandinella]